MLRWLATLTYRSIEERAADFLSDTALVGKDDEDGPAVAKNPKDAVFQVSSKDIKINKVKEE